VYYFICLFSFSIKETTKRQTIDYKQEALQQHFASGYPHLRNIATFAKSPALRDKNSSQLQSTLSLVSVCVCVYDKPLQEGVSSNIRLSFLIVLSYSFCLFLSSAETMHGWRLVKALEARAGLSSRVAGLREKIVEAAARARNLQADAARLGLSAGKKRSRRAQQHEEEVATALAALDSFDNEMQQAEKEIDALQTTVTFLLGAPAKLEAVRAEKKRLAKVYERLRELGTKAYIHGPEVMKLFAARTEENRVNEELWREMCSTKPVSDAVAQAWTRDHYSRVAAIVQNIAREPCLDTMMDTDLSDLEVQVGLLESKVLAADGSETGRRTERHRRTANRALAAGLKDCGCREQDWCVECVPLSDLEVDDSGSDFDSDQEEDEPRAMNRAALIAKCFDEFMGDGAVCTVIPCGY
jgi:hypothetical protein